MSTNGAGPHPLTLLPALPVPAPDLGPPADEALADATSILHGTRAALATIMRDLHRLEIALNDLPPAPFHDSEMLSRLRELRLQYREALKTRALLLREQAGQEATYRRAVTTVQGHQHWAERRAEWRAELQEEYADYGPQYRILIDALVEAKVRLEQAALREDSVSASEWHRITEELTRIIAQLQRYTESQKTEILQAKQNEMAIAVLQVVEGVVAPTQPELWLRVMALMEQQTLQLTGGTS